MRTLLVASEAVPLAKSGGLGDVITALAAALRNLGVEASILLPAYPQALNLTVKPKVVGELPDLPGGPATVLLGWAPHTDVPVLLLRNDALFGREGALYQDEEGRDYADNDIRYAALNHAADRIARGQIHVPRPDIVHVHDWHAGLAPLLLAARPVSGVKTVMTIHNLAFHGSFPLERAEALGVPGSTLGSDGAEFWGKLSFLKAGIRYADRVTTVSRTYAKEILTPRFGCGMDGLLNWRAQDLYAIPNGIDTDIWDPSTDTALPRVYSAADPAGKFASKRELQQMYGLPVEPFAPMVGMGSRLTSQKMADVALEAVPCMLRHHPRVQFVVLGKGDVELERKYMALRDAHPGRIGLHIGYDENKAHLLHAGSDILLHGSRFEPCGLTPLYSMRYGTIPVVSHVGGLVDNIVDATDPAQADRANGFFFHDETVDAMCNALNQALDTMANPKRWRALQRNGMNADFSWGPSARQYLELYRSLVPESAAAAKPVRQSAPEEAFELGERKQRRA